MFDGPSPPDLILLTIGENGHTAGLHPQPEDILVPAALVAPTNGTVTWFLDNDAAGSLQHTSHTSE